MECETFPAFDVVGYEFYYGVRDSCLVYFVDEVVYIDSIKGFTEVKGDYYGALRWLFLIESLGDLICDLMESSGGRMKGFEAMLMINFGDIVCDIR